MQRKGLITLGGEGGGAACKWALPLERRLYLRRRTSRSSRTRASPAPNSALSESEVLFLSRQAPRRSESVSCLKLRCTNRPLALTSPRVLPPPGHHCTVSIAVSPGRNPTTFPRRPNNFPSSPLQEQSVACTCWLQSFARADLLWARARAQRRKLPLLTLPLHVYLWNMLLSAYQAAGRERSLRACVSAPGANSRSCVRMVAGGPETDRVFRKKRKEGGGVLQCNGGVDCAAFRQGVLSFRLGKDALRK
jgi:hypothetical protein